jgi:hypothetical protein
MQIGALVVVLHSVQHETASVSLALNHVTLNPGLLFGHYFFADHHNLLVYLQVAVDVFVQPLEDALAVALKVWSLGW